MSEYKPEILQCDTFSYFPELGDTVTGQSIYQDGQVHDTYETGRYHLYSMSPIETEKGRACRYDVSYVGLVEDFVDADKTYKSKQREALQDMAQRVDA